MLWVFCPFFESVLVYVSMLTMFYNFDKDGNFSLLLETISETDINGICFETYSITRRIFCQGSS